MATKVKGESIKENSIPLSALEDDIKSSISYIGDLSPQNPIMLLPDGLSYLLNNAYLIKTGETITLYGNLNIEYAAGRPRLIADYENSTYKGIVKVFQSRQINSFELPTPIADWNAAEGEEGYIKNRTHYYNEKLQYRGEVETSINHVATYQLSPYEYIDKDIYWYRAPDKIKFTGGGTSFTLDFIKEPIPGPNDEGILEVFNKRFTIDSNNDIEVRYYYDGNPTYYEGVIIELELIATDSGYQEYITFTTEDYYVDLKQIDGVYIPGTVVKTTPQRLSDEDKNQVKENLGLGEVATKQELTELSAEVGKKVDADFVNNAIAEAITTTLNTEV